jgi:hypothetical protein
MIDHPQLIYINDEEPMQPIGIDSKGDVRFLENRMVLSLYLFGLDHQFGMDEMGSSGQYSDEEWRQFSQLLGWHLHTWVEQPFVNPSSRIKARLIANQLGPGQVIYIDDEEPMQPIGLDPHGVVRFLENRMVRDLYRFAEPHGMDMNLMAGTGKFTDEEWRQFAQLIGYSVSGWGTLSYVDRYSCDKADRVADELLDQQRPF